jgi:NAD(P)-dependent dehydrogenase (short-subunit alcohol dehydrogenase family)
MTETVFISGAGKGLGFALAVQFLQAGFHVFAGQYSPSARLAGLMDKYPETLSIVPLDISSMDSIRQAGREVEAKTPVLDILINNAAVYLEDKAGTLEELDLSDEYFQKTMNVNAFGPLRMVQQFLPLLKKGGRKMIVNISSEAGSIGDCPRGREFAYCMSKTALNMETKLLQNYLGPQGFKLLAVQPGWMQTDMGGPDAQVDPNETAQGVFGLATRLWKADDIIFLDYQGNPLPW